MKKTKPKKDYGYYCDICGRKICKYNLDFNSSGAICIDVITGFIESKTVEICHDCAKEIAEAVLDEF